MVGYLSVSFSYHMPSNQHCRLGLQGAKEPGVPSVPRPFPAMPFVVWGTFLKQLAVFGAVEVAFVLWTAAKQRRLSKAAQASRRAKLKLRIIHSTRCGGPTACCTRAQPVRNPNYCCILSDVTLSFSYVQGIMYCT